MRGDTNFKGSDSSDCSRYYDCLLSILCYTTAVDCDYNLFLIFSRNNLGFQSFPLVMNLWYCIQLCFRGRLNSSLRANFLTHAHACTPTSKCVQLLHVIDLKNP